MPGKKKVPKFKKVAKDVTVGVRVCCSNVLFEPTEQQKQAGMDKLLGKAEGVVLQLEPKGKKWLVQLDNGTIQPFTKREMTVLDFVEEEIRPRTKNNVVLVPNKKKTAPSAVIVAPPQRVLTLMQMERECHESGTPTKTPTSSVLRKSPPSTPPPSTQGKRLRLSPSIGGNPYRSPTATPNQRTDVAGLTSPGTEQSTPTPKTANTSAHSMPASKDTKATTVTATSIPLTQEVEVLDGDGPVEFNLEATTPARILQHLKTTGLDPSKYDSDDNTELVETADSFQLRDVEAADETDDTTTNNEDLGYETDDTVQTQGEGAAADEVETEDAVQFPQDLEVFIEQNSDAAPPPILGQRLTFHDLEENELDSEIRLRSERARERAMAEDAIVEVDEVNDKVLRWVPIAKLVPTPEQDHGEYKELGVRGVKFNAKDFNPLDYFILMFPGDWRLKLHQLNVRIENERQRKVESTREGKARERGIYMEKCTEEEFFRFIGIMIAASLHRNGGRPLWMTKSTATCAAPNFGKYLLFVRFS